MSVRLIKGAYWDYEVIHAERMGWPVPVWTDKRATDACFERMAAIFVEAMPHSAGEGGVKLALGSHNVRSIAYTLALLEKNGTAAVGRRDFKSSTAWPIRSARPWWSKACGFASTCPWAR